MFGVLAVTLFVHNIAFILWGGTAATNYYAAAAMASATAPTTTRANHRLHRCCLSALGRKEYGRAFADSWVNLQDM